MSKFQIGQVWKDGLGGTVLIVQITDSEIITKENGIRREYELNGQFWKSGPGKLDLVSLYKPDY